MSKTWELQCCVHSEQLQSFRVVVRAGSNEAAVTQQCECTAAHTVQDNAMQKQGHLVPDIKRNRGTMLEWHLLNNSQKKDLSQLSNLLH